MSVSKVARRRGTMLDEIMGYWREQLPKTMREVPIADLRALVALVPEALDFRAAISVRGVSLIAECKKASPSKGLLIARYNAVELARTFVSAGASAVSVLTDGRHFQGSLEDLRNVKESLSNTKAIVSAPTEGRLHTGIPVLRKDFIFHPYQLYESRAAGADAVLLIAAVLQDGELRQLLALAGELGLQALIEVHTEAELERALSFGPAIIGINNRNLQTFEVDFENTGRLRSLVPSGILTVAESGVKTADDIRLLRELGIDAVLVGETLVTSRNKYETTRDLVNAGRS